MEEKCPYEVLDSSVSECSSLSASRKLQIVGLVQVTIPLILEAVVPPFRQVGGLRKSAYGGIPLVPSKLVPSQVYSMYPAKAAMSCVRRGLRCIHAMLTSPGGTKGRTPIIWNDFRTSDPTTWYSGTRSVLENFLQRALEDGAGPDREDGVLESVLEVREDAVRFRGLPIPVPSQGEVYKRMESSSRRCTVRSWVKRLGDVLKVSPIT